MKCSAWLLVVLLILAVSAVTASTARADYIGPNRPRPAVRDTSGDYVVMAKVSGPGSVSVCQINTGAAGGDCNTYPSLEQQEYWCNSGVLHPPGWCGAHPGSCWQGQIIDRYCHYTGGGSYPPATVSGSAFCSLPGTNGWCRSGAGLFLSASEPLAGQVITYIESDAFGVLCDPPNAGNLSCSWAAPEGVSNLQFWAHSSFGDTSTSASASLAQDSLAPVIGPLPAPTGGAGWFTGSPPSLSCTASDAVSGVAGSAIRMDGGEWLANVTVPEGVHSLECTASDQAGNTSTTAAQEVCVDLSAPEFSVSAGPEPGSGWLNQTPFVSAAAVDALSGMGSVCIRTSTGLSQCSVENVALEIVGEGEIQVFVDAVDLAGNSAEQRWQTFFVDTTPPEMALLEPGMSPHVSNGQVVLSGTALDALSGLKEVLLSMDNGSSWSSLELADGAWSHTWDTLSAADGEHTLIARAVDLAGNISAGAVLQVVVNNQPPVVDLTPRWSVGQSGALAVSANPSSAIQSVEACILDGAGSLVYTFPGDLALLSELQWDGRRENGIWAEPGSYSIEVSAVDLAGRSTTEFGEIVIPFPPTPTPRSFFSFVPPAASTPSPTPGQTPTHSPTPDPTRANVIENTVALEPLPQVKAVIEKVEDTDPPGSTGYAWLRMGFLAALVMLIPALTGSLDPRPPEVLRWADYLEKRIRKGE